jgi:hypothetical protein
VSSRTAEQIAYLTTDDPDWWDKAMALPDDAPVEMHPCSPEHVAPFCETFAVRFEMNRAMRRQAFRPVQPMDGYEAYVLDNADVDADLAPAVRGDLWGASEISFDEAGRIYQALQMRGIEQFVPSVVAAPRRRTEPGRVVRSRGAHGRRVRSARRGDPDDPDPESSSGQPRQLDGHSDSGTRGAL